MIELELDLDLNLYISGVEVRPSTDRETAHRFAWPHQVLGPRDALVAMVTLDESIVSRRDFPGVVAFDDLSERASERDREMYGIDGARRRCGADAVTVAATTQHVASCAAGF